LHEGIAYAHRPSKHEVSNAHIDANEKEGEGEREREREREYIPESKVDGARPSFELPRVALLFSRFFS